MAEKLKIDDVSWIPRGKALSIPDNLEEEQHEAEERLIGNLRCVLLNMLMRTIASREAS